MGWFSNAFSGFVDRAKDFTGAAIHAGSGIVHETLNSGATVLNNVENGVSKIPKIVAAGAQGAKDAIDNIVNSKIFQTAGMNLADDLNIVKNADSLTPSILGLSASTVVLGGLGLVIALKVL